MIHTVAITTDYNLINDLPLEALSGKDILWYWVDFNCPTEEETNYLETFFHFHPLAIEDCLHFIQRPKLDAYGAYTFFVLHALNQKSYEAEEVDVFLGEKFIISFHQHPSKGIQEIRQKLLPATGIEKKGPLHILYMIVDSLVDEYFPILYEIEDRLNEVEDNTKGLPMGSLMEEVFEIRSDLIHLRKTIIPMRDLLYRMNASTRIQTTEEQQFYFTDIYDHLLKLTDMIESNRDLTADIRDSYISLNTNRMNTIMMTLTVITTIFMPLTFIAGVYGMNFEFMPELEMRYSYFIVLGVMASLGGSMFLWFKRKGWFEE
jgi:magnesium transporter